MIRDLVKPQRIIMTEVNENPKKFMISEAAKAKEEIFQPEITIVLPTRQERLQAFHSPESSINSDVYDSIV